MVVSSSLLSPPAFSPLLVSPPISSLYYNIIILFPLLSSFSLFLQEALSVLRRVTSSQRDAMCSKSLNCSIYGKCWKPDWNQTYGWWGMMCMLLYLRITFNFVSHASTSRFNRYTAPDSTHYIHIWEIFGGIYTCSNMLNWYFN